MGRYNIINIQNAIDESYQYWNLNAGKGFDIYWAEYREYVPNLNGTTQIKLNFTGNTNK